MDSFVIIRLEGTMLSFGGVQVDENGPTNPFPAASMLTGLLANALGWDHSDTEQLETLQSRLRFAVRCDRPGERLIDYQTVDLGQQHLVRPGWTTRARTEKRRGGTASKGTHIRLRHFLTDACYTLVVGLNGHPDLSAEDLHRALRYPRRPLFLGRKCCLPSAPLAMGLCRGANAISALRSVPVQERSQPVDGRFQAWWPAEEWSGAGDGADIAAVELMRVTDERRWATQLHGGERAIRTGMVRWAQSGAEDG